MADTEKEIILDVKDLEVEFQSPLGAARAVRGASFQIRKGEIFALVGESGCGKSVTAASIMQILPRPIASIKSGEILIDGEDIVKMNEPRRRKMRGNQVSMIFQEPQTSLNPVFTIRNQLAEVLKVHKKMSESEIDQRCIELLTMVGIAEPEQRLSEYPHQLSGGMKQRVMIALALSCEPQVLIADEPTTALDVTIQAQVLNLINELRERMDTAILLITHDLGVVRQVADRVAVMYAGNIVETSEVENIFSKPKHPYTRKLLRSIPSRLERGQKLAIISGTVPSATETPKGCAFYDRCYARKDNCLEKQPPLDEGNHQVACFYPDTEETETVDNKEKAVVDGTRGEDLSIKNLKVYYPIRKGLLKRTVGHVKAVDDLSIEVPRGKTVALVGESGCGKTTLGKMLVGLEDAIEGSAKYGNQNLRSMSRSQKKELCKKIQFIFQDPFSSLDPRMMVFELIGEGMQSHAIAKSQKDIIDKTSELLEMVGLPQNAIYRYPHEFSGGQRQRISIARALAVMPELIICDEATSALDVSVQAQILNLLKDLQSQLSLSYLFITHNLSVVEYFCNYVYIMYLGEIVEHGTVEAIFDDPKHPYTKALLQAVPRIDEHTGLQNIKLNGDIPSPINPPSGCRFHTRCSEAKPECSKESPVETQFENQSVRCLLYK
jgi:peptide/nickel transport system ATP-binding protein